MPKFAPLLLFCALIGLASYPLLAGDDDTASPEGESQDFRVARDDTPTGLERLETEIHTILTSLVTGELDASEGEAIRVRITVILQEEGIGRAALRDSSVRQTLETVLHEARQHDATSDALTEMQRTAITALASQTANELVARVSGGDHELTLLGPMPEGYAAVSWNTLGEFEWTEGMELPENVRELNSTRVGVQGVLMALDTDTEFLLVQSLFSCCYGEPPSMNQAIVVNVEEGTEVSSGVPVRILGTLQVGEEREDGEVIGLYRIAADQVEVGQ